MSRPTEADVYLAFVAGAGLATLTIYWLLMATGGV